MPQASYEYAAATISVMSSKMLTSAQVRKIYEAKDFRESLILLLDTGYGGNLSIDQIANEEIDYVIREQLKLSREMIWKITPEPELTSIFFLPVDAHNMKTLLKARLMGIDAPDVLLNGGIFDTDKLREEVLNKNYIDLPPILRRTMEEIEVDLQREVEPSKFSAKIDGAVFEYSKSIIDKADHKGFIKDYISLIADFNNVRSVIRARALKWDASKLKYFLLVGGSIDHKVLLEALETPLEQLSGKLNRGPDGKIIAYAIDEYATTRDIPLIKKRIDQAILNLLSKEKWNTFSLGFIANYLVGREAEAKALRLIFGAKRAGFEIELPELYA
jgi:V/A-type H+-transporting ATPase subunit C